MIRTKQFSPWLVAIFGAGLVTAAQAEEQGNWLSWRGPLQTGVSLEDYENPTFHTEPLWTDELSGGGTPVIYNGRLYTWGYRGEGPDLVEVIQAREESTGELIWEREESDFISDTIYNRYSIGAPAVDPETENVIVATTFGLVTCYSKEGETLWQHSMVERFGRLTFPNGRAGAPVIDGNIAIIRGVTSYWGADGPARDRFFGFDKKTGDLIWSSTPGVGPPFLKDSSMSTPYLDTRQGMRVFYAGTGCGNVVCVNVKNGQPLWRYQISKGGVNSSPLLLGDKLICVHGKENLDTTEMGRLFAINLPSDYLATGGEIDPVQKGAPRLPADVEVWRNPIEMFTSSPVLHEGKVYQMSKQGVLFCVDAKSGKTLWEEKLSNSQLHASPLFVDGMLIVPTFPGILYVLDVTGDKPKTLVKEQLEGNSVGSAAVCNGKVYVHTTKRLYCFGIKNDGIVHGEEPAVSMPEAGDPAGLQAIPSDLLLTSGSSKKVSVRTVDAAGFPVADAGEAAWESFIPPTAKVKAKMDASFSGNTISAAEDAQLSAGAWKGTVGDFTGFARGRVIADLPYLEDFESFELTADSSAGGKMAFPPLPWIGARLKWEVRELDGNQVLAKTLDRVLFQRSLSFIGDPELSDYTMQADVMTDGNRRIKSVVGLINQRYIISLVGNANLLEVSSNHERVKESVPFRISANTWYTLKTSVKVSKDGSGVIRAKAWLKDEPEPADWTIEVDHQRAHRKGAPGLFGFAPQSQKSVFVDNISITPNEK